MVRLHAYDMVYHAHAKVGEVDPQALHRQQCRTVAFLARKLFEDLASGDKIAVFRQNEPLLASDLVTLRLALARTGPSVLLWVRDTYPGHPPGSVVM